jgi:hypothetical protein
VDQTERTLWTLHIDNRSIECVMRSCCAGAELQVLTMIAPEGESTIVLRELYPTRSDLYERARLLEAHYRHGQHDAAEPTS